MRLYKVILLVNLAVGIGFCLDHSGGRKRLGDSREVTGRGQGDCIPIYCSALAGPGHCASGRP
jgi:hypothetical protein